MKTIRDRWVPQINGFLFIAILVGGGAFLFVSGRVAFEDIPFAGEAGIVVVVIIGMLLASGFRILEPNESAILIFFGKYMGTLKRSGFIWSLPFTSTNKISLRIHTLNTPTIKVNDALGNPIEIGAVVVWRVSNSAKALLNVDNFMNFVNIQSESAVRTLTAKFPYDTHEEGVPSLRGSPELVSKALLDGLQESLAPAGVTVEEAKISHLAYAPEIAGAMLKRQQAFAIVSARKVITENAVTMVENVIDDLDERRVLALTNEQKASLVSNLMVALVSDSDAQPIVDIGSR